MQMEEECESTEDAITYMAGFDEQLTAFEAKTKVKDRIHMIKMINYSFKCIPFFFLHLLQPQAITRGVCRTRGATRLKVCFEFKCGSWHKHGEPTCNQCRCSEVKTMR